MEKNGFRGTQWNLSKEDHIKGGSVKSLRKTLSCRLNAMKNPTALKKELEKLLKKDELDFDVDSWISTIRLVDNTHGKKLVVGIIKKMKKINSVKKQENYLKDITKKILGDIQKTKDSSKTLYQVIQESCYEENYQITEYTKEKMAQALVGLTKDYIVALKEKQIEPEDLETQFLKNIVRFGLKRSREWQRWTERELNSLWKLWHDKCFDPKKIANIMGRGEESVERIIDWLEDRWYNHPHKSNKEINTQNC